jgi:hypothetical protein
MPIAQDIGSYLECFPALDAAVITAAAGNDNVAVDGNVCDRLAIHQGQLCQSAKLVIAYKAVLADTKTLSVAASLKSSTASGGTYAALTALRARHVKSDGTITALTLTSGALAATVLVTASGATTARGVVELDVPLVVANEFLRATVTADLSNTATDTVALSAVLVLGGSDVVPA